MSDDKTLVAYEVTVKAIEERRQLREAHKSADGTESSKHDDLGWFVTLAEFNIAVRVGDVKPADLSAGQKLIFILERP